MPEYRLTLDPRNPGQFFACCGLFELSDLLAQGAQACFENHGATFVLYTDAPVPPQVKLEPQPDFNGKPYDATLEPLTLTRSGLPFTLNWWLNDTLTQKSRLKTWGGQQTPRRVLSELLQLLDFTIPCRSLLEFAAYTKSRFGVDARSAWEPLDTGYSPNDLGQDATTYPWTEVLAVAGLQGFRPVESKLFHYEYSVWFTPLPVAVARAACAAPWPGLPSRSFSFVIAPRGQGYKTFLFAEGADSD